MITTAVSRSRSIQGHPEQNGEPGRVKVRLAVRQRSEWWNSGANTKGRPFEEQRINEAVM